MCQLSIRPSGLWRNAIQDRILGIVLIDQVGRKFCEIDLGIDHGRITKVIFKERFLGRLSAVAVLFSDSVSAGSRTPSLHNAEPFLLRNGFSGN